MDVAPDWKNLLGPHKNGLIDDNEYTRRYIALLDKNKTKILNQYRAIRKRFDGCNIVLLCWCKKGNFCHRRLLAEWLERNGKERIEELY